MTAPPVEALVIKHFNEYQKGTEDVKKRRGVSDASVEARVALLRQELASKNVTALDSDDDDEFPNGPVYQATAAVLRCVDTAMATEISKDSQDAVDCIFELAACFACSGGNGHLAQALTARAVQFSVVIMERVRVQACNLLGLCVRYLLTGDENGGEEDSWRDECVDVARQAIRSRLTDKSQAVRNAAIYASASLFVRNKELDDNDEEFLESLLWNMNHDPSAANRSSALQSVPIVKDTVDDVIARVRDVKVKVRVEALNTLCSKMLVYTLSSVQYAELVRSGLTDR